MLISIALISLGAPFWYELLKNLIRLRSMVATKDEDERKTRQTAQPDVRSGAATAVPGGSQPPAPAPRPAAMLAGERGNLAAIG